MSNRAEEVANAVLYEGYILYPYRPSSVKNQQRWNFGVVYPPGSSEGAVAMQTECLAMVSSSGAPPEFNAARIDINVRFLHLMARSVRQLMQPVPHLPEGAEPESQPVQKLESGGRMFQAWQEGIEQKIEIADCGLGELMARPLHREFTLPASRTVEPVPIQDGLITGLIVREQSSLYGSVEVSAGKAGNELVRITVRLENHSARHTAAQGEEQSARDEVLLRSFVSAHKILTLHGGEFISLIDPPEHCREAAENCRNTGTWPVLAGEEGQRDVMLSSPIILYDYPQIAPESAGDLCDGTEIDEILSLRILTLTEEEKREMRQSDERGRRILERTENLQEEEWMKLHGILRGLRPNPEVTQ